MTCNFWWESGSICGWVSRVICRYFVCIYRLPSQRRNFGGPRKIGDPEPKPPERSA